MVLDYSKFANIDVSDDDAPTPPVERYKGPSLEASAYAKRVVERQRKARAKGTAKACVGDDWKDVDDVFKGDAATFEPEQRHGRCIRWGLPVIDPVKALRRRGVVRELYADKPKDWRPAPERQFVNALMRRRKKAHLTIDDEVSGAISREHRAGNASANGLADQELHHRSLKPIQEF